MGRRDRAATGRCGEQRKQLKPRPECRACNLSGEHVDKEEINAPHHSPLDSRQTIELKYLQILVVAM